MATWQPIDPFTVQLGKMRSAQLPSLLLTSSIIYVLLSLEPFLVSAGSGGGLLVDEDSRLPSFTKSTVPGSGAENAPANESQSTFKSHIYCGGSEFYVQITFKRPFKGLLYAYRNMQQEDGMPPSLHYPVQILDTCTLRGNGASMIYLELSFLSECVEHLAAFMPSLPDITAARESSTEKSPSTSSAETSRSTTSTASPMSMPISPVDSDNAQKYNLDGFNFRRALDTSLPLVNITSDQTYQLSLYIQNDPNLEQKTDSKVTIQCSSQVTKNIVVEQNLASSDFSRRVDSAPGVGKNRTIVPTASLTEDTQSLNQSLGQSVMPTARIDVLRGRVPFVKLIDSRVELGDDLTVIIRAKAKPDGFEWKVSQCYAHEGNNTVRHELTNQHGCPVDGNLMPAFKVLHQPTAEYSTVFYTSFAAFKFAISNHLHIECRVVLCRLPCSEVSCPPLMKVCFTPEPNINAQVLMQHHSLSN